MLKEGASLLKPIQVPVGLAFSVNLMNFGLLPDLFSPSNLRNLCTGSNPAIQLVSSVKVPG